jgi:hypothetical protein
MDIEFGPTEFERLLHSLDGLTRSEIAELVMAGISGEEAATFALLTHGLSLDALRFVSARALMRFRRLQEVRGASGQDYVPPHVQERSAFLHVRR